MADDFAKAGVEFPIRLPHRAGDTADELLGMLPDDDGELTGGGHPNHTSSAILFERLGQLELELLEGVRSLDNHAGLIDFRRIVPIPDGLKVREARDWGDANWGVDHNATDPERVTRFGFEGIVFHTEIVPETALKALAAKWPKARWSYFAADWHITECARGEAKDGVFTLTRYKERDGDRSEQIRMMCFGDR